ncbi:glycosyltransferase [Chryseolinea sp. T2]|uniref:glycosyltransferase n=1 Tax=Chryseolinea sp. T2 TaxID=3129255 RepID=UPI0030784CC8
MKLLVGIVTFNRCATLLNSIKEHVNSHIDESNILVVDNNSDDGTQEQLKLQFPKIRLVQNPENIGSAGGFAVAMQYALEHQYDYIWLYNDDSHPKSGAKELMATALQDLESKSEKIGMLKMGMLRNGKSEASYWRGKRITKWVEKSNIPIKTDLITFDGCIINVGVIRQIGTCDARFFMGVYEFDFCLRALDAGYEIYTLPAGLIEDPKMGSAKGVPAWRMYYVTRNQLYFALKRKSFSAVSSFALLEAKKIASIVFTQDNKRLRLRMKIKALIDGATGRMGKRVIPSSAKK